MRRGVPGTDPGDPLRSKARDQRMSDDTPPLPDVFMSVLARAEAERILHDIQHHAELIAVTIKQDAMAHAADPVADLERARAFLADDALRGLQLRYRFGADVWTDTLLRLPSGSFRLVRMASPVDGTRELPG